MISFEAAEFAQILLTDILFYDPEYGVLGVVSLIDPNTNEECYVCSFDPEDETFVIEKGSEWEADDLDEDVGYALARDLEEYGRYETPEEAALVLFTMAQEEDLLPSVSLHFEADDA